MINEHTLCDCKTPTHSLYLRHKQEFFLKWETASEKHDGIIPPAPQPTSSKAQDHKGLSQRFTAAGRAEQELPVIQVCSSSVTNRVNWRSARLWSSFLFQWMLKFQTLYRCHQNTWLCSLLLQKRHASADGTFYDSRQQHVNSQSKKINHWTKEDEGYFSFYFIRCIFSLWFDLNFRS